MNKDCPYTVKFFDCEFLGGGNILSKGEGNPFGGRELSDFRVDVLHRGCKFSDSSGEIFRSTFFENQKHGSRPKFLCGCSMDADVRLITKLCYINTL